MKYTASVPAAVAVLVDVNGNVIAPVMLAALVNRNDIVDVTDAMDDDPTTARDRRCRSMRRFEKLDV